MPEAYFELPASDQHEILSAASQHTGRAASILEKDIWLSLVLKSLFSAPDRKPMAFKGGTSLSKVYSVIERFSEDVDITIDYRSLGCETPISELVGLSRGQRDRIGQSLRDNVRAYTHEIIRPHLEAQIAELACGSDCAVEISEDGEKMMVYYPTRAEDQDGYLREFVLIEFGGRNIVNPNEVHAIRPDISEVYPGLAFPVAEDVVVLAADRTFWEKVTLIHAACNKPFPTGLNRNARHWYDLAMLFQHECGQRAMADFDLLEDVIALKSVFYNSKTTNYQQCLAGELNLLPSGENLRLLHEDYLAMQEAGMLNGHILPLEAILVQLSQLQTQINTEVVRRSVLPHPNDPA